MNEPLTAEEGLDVLGVAVLQGSAAMTVGAFLSMKPDAMQYPVAQEIVEGSIPRMPQGGGAGAMPYLMIVDCGGR